LSSRSVKPRECHEGKVDRREHELDAHENDDCVPMDENANHADDEERRSERK
jgi:hypothetical protein